MPMVYSQFFIGSETFDRLRSPKYTPSVSLSLDSSLREGAGATSPHNVNHPPAGYFVSGRVIFGGFCVGGFCHSTGYSLKSGGCGRFSSPLRTLKFLHFTVQPTGPYYSGWAPWNSMWRGSICQWFWVMVSSFWESLSSRPGLRVMHSRVGPAPLRQKAAPVVRTRASMRE